MQCLKIPLLTLNRIGQKKGHVYNDSMSTDGFSDTKSIKINSHKNKVRKKQKKEKKNRNKKQ